MNLFVSFKYLLALDEQRHFGRAALACHVTQPALSNALRALEESLGVAIVTRGRSFAGFTTEGERVLASARRMLREHELLQQELQSSASSPSGQLHIGAVPMCMPVAARFVGMLHDLHPGIVCTLRSMSSPELESGLENMVLDMAMGYPERLEGTRAPLRVVPQYTEHYFLLRRADQPSPAGLQKGPTTTWAEAATLPLCLLTGEMHNRTIVDSAFRRGGGLCQQHHAGRAGGRRAGLWRAGGTAPDRPVHRGAHCADGAREQPPLTHAGGRARLRTEPRMADTGRAAWQSVRGIPPCGTTPR